MTKTAQPLLPRVDRADTTAVAHSLRARWRIVIANTSGLDFDALQLRIHPAASRVKLLAQQTPASIVFFDLLCEGDRDLRDVPFAVPPFLAGNRESVQRPLGRDRYCR